MVTVTTMDKIGLKCEHVEYAKCMGGVQTFCKGMSPICKCNAYQTLVTNNCKTSTTCDGSWDFTCIDGQMVDVEDPYLRCINEDTKLCHFDLAIGTCPSVGMFKFSA